MAKYFLKRLLLFLPTLWIISTVIFLLSKHLPGESGSQLFEQETETSYGAVGQAARQEIYRAYLRRTGQDLPLFYFSLRSQAEPDTLHLVFPEQDRVHLHRILLKLGNWPQVANFYNEYKALRQKVAALPPSPARSDLVRQVELLLVKAEKLQAASAMEAIQKNLAGQLPGSEVANKAAATAAAYHQMIRASTPILTYLPAVQWHGLQNQYHAWFYLLTQGSLGTSMRDERPVTEMIGEALGNTFWLMFGGFALAVVLGLEVSLVLNSQSGRRWSKPVMGFLFILDSIPLFILALAVLVAVTKVGVFQGIPVYGASYRSQYVSWGQAFVFQFSYLALPLLCLTLARLPYVTGLGHRALQETLSSAYVTTAQAKGLAEGKVLRKHRLRNALLPLITLFSEFLPSLVAGALILEVVFAIPGVGRLLTDAVLGRDYPVIVGVVLLVALVKMGAYLLADGLYFLADPRLKRAP